MKKEHVSKMMMKRSSEVYPKSIDRLDGVAMYETRVQLNPFPFVRTQQETQGRTSQCEYLKWQSKRGQPGTTQYRVM
jgi:hypothetical protein